ncbi:MAG: fatty acid hydroxylase [Myxococcales bacterium]|nr:fatty acid hydroxylase [Myxococcales bacterium]
MNHFSTISEAILDPFLSVLDPEKRVFWPFLVASLVLALWVAVKERRERSLRSFLTYLFPMKIWLHASALLDYRLLFAKALLRLVLITPWAMSAFGLSVWWVGILNKNFGVVSPVSMDKTQIMVLYTLILFIGWDLSRYVLHRLLHTVPFLWEFHKVHHSAEVLTPFTLYRSHPVESMLYALRGVLVVSAITGTFFYFFKSQAIQYEVLSVNVLGFFFNFTGGNLRHSHVWLSYGKKFEHIFISPAQHQVHHSVDEEHFNKNYGTWLSVWDWLSGTLYVTSEKEGLRFGLSEAELNHDPHRVGSILVFPLWAGIKRLWPQKLPVKR